MARVIGIMGESGSGKTTSMRNLDPKTTFYIDCDKEGVELGRDGKRITTQTKRTISRRMWSVLSPPC